jgi:hypothetical protein
LPSGHSGHDAAADRTRGREQCPEQRRCDERVVEAECLLVQGERERQPAEREQHPGVRPANPAAEQEEQQRREQVERERAQARRGAPVGDRGQRHISLVVHRSVGVGVRILGTVGARRVIDGPAVEDRDGPLHASCRDVGVGAPVERPAQMHRREHHDADEQPRAGNHARGRRRRERVAPRSAPNAGDPHHAHHEIQQRWVEQQNRPQTPRALAAESHEHRYEGQQIEMQDRGARANVDEG